MFYNLSPRPDDGRTEDDHDGDGGGDGGGSGGRDAAGDLYILTCAWHSTF